MNVCVLGNTYIYSVAALISFGVEVHPEYRTSSSTILKPTEIRAGGGKMQDIGW